MVLARPVAGDPVDGGGGGRVECRVVHDENAVGTIHLGLCLDPERGRVGFEATPRAGERIVRRGFGRVRLRGGGLACRDDVRRGGDKLGGVFGVHFGRVHARTVTAKLAARKRPSVPTA